MLQPLLAQILFSRQAQPAYICLPSEEVRGERGGGENRLHQRLALLPCYFSLRSWRFRQDSHLHPRI